MSRNRITFLIVLITAIFFNIPNSMAELTCTPPAGSELIFKNENVQFIVFGELHGTDKSPTIFSEIVCLAVSSGNKVLVGLEFPESAGPAFQDFLASEGTIEDENRFLMESHWIQPVNFSDGRTSQAMLNMVKRLRLLYEAGNDLSITTFQPQMVMKQNSQTPYEKNMATSLIESKKKEDYDLVIVLVGNAHAAKSVEAFSFEPMAMHLPKELTLSFYMTHSGGSTWACGGELNESGMPKCGIHLFDSMHDELISKIVLDDQLFPGFDGIFNAGSISASPPVK